MKYAKGDYIKFLFQDDVLLPGCIENQLNDLEKNGLKVVCCGRLIIDDKSKLIETGDWLRDYGDLQKFYNIDKSVKSVVFSKKY